MADDLLDSFLSVAAEEYEEVTVPKLKDINTLNEDSLFLSSITNYEKDVINNKVIKPKRAANKKNLKSSVVHKGDTDSSDDEENRECQNKKYNEFGKSIKDLLGSPASSKSDSSVETTWRTKRPVPTSSSYETTASHLATKCTSIGVRKTKQSVLPFVPKIDVDIFTDPTFGIRITKPLISHGMLIERMQGKTPVPMIRIRRYVELLKKDSDWVIAGVLVSKSGKTTQKGNPFSIWTLSDLHNDLKTVTLFLFGSAYKQLWKSVIGTVIGVLNPNVFENKAGSKDEACLSIDNSQRVMIFGHSKDLGICKSTKKNGEKCTAFVNVNKCEFCIYHIKQEYQKCSKRSELQSNFSGQGLTALRNKVLGKNEVFYAGKSFMAIPAGKSKKLQQKDDNRLSILSGAMCNTSNTTKIGNKARNIEKKLASHVELSINQRKKDLELLKKLGGGTDVDLMKRTDFTATPSSSVTIEASKSAAIDILAKLKANSAKKDLVKPLESKYNKALDLHTIENKNKFGAKVSSEVTLQESKSSALSVIAKLKAKKNEETIKPTIIQGEKQTDFLDPNNLSDLEFDLSDTEIEALEREKNTKSKESQKRLGNVQNGFNLSSTLKPVVNTTPTNSPTLTQETAKKPNLSGIITNGSQLSQTSQRNGPLIADPKYGPMDFPLLSGLKNTMVDLNSPVQKKHVDRAKLNAMKWVQRNGPIKKTDPNANKVKGKKRPLDNVEVISDAKKQKIQENEYFSDRFKKIMAASSKHADLLEERDNEEAEKYFNKLEMKEKMEEKMANTYKIECKAVRCLKCKYTSFSAAELCKTERHPLKVFDAFKRFFKCGNCGSRTVSLDIIPILSCKNCGSSKWERTTMMKDNNISSAHTLSIRGGEQKYTNADATNTHINLLVPDSGTGFMQIEKKHAAIFKRVKAMLPRRESERRIHPLFRHCDILSAVETRISMLNMTYMKYIQTSMCCFIPGKVLDELERVLGIVELTGTPPRTHEILQELRDISSMAMEYFDEKILPNIKDQTSTLVPFSNASVSTNKGSRVFFIQPGVQDDINKIKRFNKRQKMQIGFLSKVVHKLFKKVERQRTSIRTHSKRIKEQAVKINEQNVKIQEHENTITEIKKQIEDWDQKFGDLSSEVIRSKDDIVNAVFPTLHNSPPSSIPTVHKTVTKPRLSQVQAPNTYITELERKRKSTIEFDIPHKFRFIAASESALLLRETINNKINENITQNISKNITQNANMKRARSNYENSSWKKTDLTHFLSTSFESLLKNPITSIQSRKRKMTDDINK